MSYKALLIDLDGTTVLPFAKEPSERVVRAVEAIKPYLFVGIATGRRINSTRPIMEKLGLTGPCILNHGAQIFDPLKGEFVHEQLISNSAISEIYEYCDVNGIEMKLLDPYSAIDPKAQDVSAYNGGARSKKILSVWMPLVPLSTVEKLVADLSKIPDVAVMKLSSVADNTIAVEVTHARATKQYGVAKVIEYLKIKPEHVVGVGDGYNDFPLLSACGLKFAMGNAVPELKAIADFVAPTVQEDGLATIIEKFLLPIVGK